MTPGPRRYTAPWVLPLEGPPLAQGAVLLAADGRIAAVGPAERVPAAPGTPTEDLAGAVLLPGLVNAHTHLELTGLDDRLPEQDFAAWIRQLIALKAARPRAEVLEAARRGVRNCWAAGITTVADTGDSGTVIEALAELGGSGIAYHEVFGPDPSRCEAAFAEWTARLDQLTRFAGPRVRLGASPHAPYSVSGLLYRKVAEHAADRGLPLAVHLAESREETELLRRASGSFARNWEARGIPLPQLPGRSPVEWLEQHGVLGPGTLCIHLVQADGGDLDLLARSGAAAAHCPRSNQRHGHGAAPLQGMLRRGLRVGVGTDSVASVSPLDLLAEARAARAIGALAAETALGLVTSSAARALGLDDEIGSLRPGKWGDLTAFDLPPLVDASRLADTVLSLAPNAVRLTVVGGREVYRRTQRESSPP